jgi:hypothetical protein
MTQTLITDYYAPVEQSLLGMLLRASVSFCRSVTIRVDDIHSTIFRKEYVQTKITHYFACFSRYERICVGKPIRRVIQRTMRDYFTN